VEYRKFAQEFDPRFKIFHELMRRKVREILLVSTPYDAWSMEEDGRLVEELVCEYRGLNLSSPPRLRWVANGKEALAAMKRQEFDMAILVSRGVESEHEDWLGELRRTRSGMSIVHLIHQGRVVLSGGPRCRLPSGPIERAFQWRGNRDLLVALVKSVEDQLNAEHDTHRAGIRVIILVEDSPEYLSLLLPVLYKEIVVQTRSLIEQGLNEDHRLLAMRARPKILIAQSYEEAMNLYETYEPYVLGVFSDVQFPREGALDPRAGIDFLRLVHKDRFDIPLLLMSSDARNAARARGIPAAFIDKNAPDLGARVRGFMLKHLGFGDFVFRDVKGRKEIARARNLRELANCMERVPDKCFVVHGRRNDFSRWLYARAEIEVADQVRPMRFEDFQSPESHRKTIVGLIRERLRQRERGLVIEFDPLSFDGRFEFLKMGGGSIGGKARGLAFVAATMLVDPELGKKFPGVEIRIPPSLVLATGIFEEFVERNRLGHFAHKQHDEAEVARRFVKGSFSKSMRERLKKFLAHVGGPLAVRSSGLLADGYFTAYAGLYRTVMLPNDHPNPRVRLQQLTEAIKLVYASTYGAAPRAFAERVGHRLSDERMAVIIQKLAGRRYGDWFHPAVSGVAQSVNYYPFGRMEAEHGVATIAAGFGLTVVQGGKAWRFSPRNPEVQPQQTTAQSVLDCVQREFYSLHLPGSEGERVGQAVRLRPLGEEADEEPFVRLASTWVPEEGRIRDTVDMPGQRVMTFAPLLKYRLVDLPGILRELLGRGQWGMGCPVELEFSLDLAGADEPPVFHILQLRPMSARQEHRKVVIEQRELEAAVCTGSQALGNGIYEDIRDIIFVEPEEFDPAKTREIAARIGEVNMRMSAEGRRYLIIGPGRWGSADPWLGIPVEWSQIAGVGAFVEARHERLVAEPSQGSHFFHNLTTMGIPYMSQAPGDRIDWDWLRARPQVEKLGPVVVVRPEMPVRLKVDGRGGRGVLLEAEK
jgi:hypothetical protein